jgi:hypothetical protein
VNLATIEALSVSDYSSRLGSALRDVGGALLEGEVQGPKKIRTQRFAKLSPISTAVCAERRLGSLAEALQLPESGD